MSCDQAFPFAAARTQADVLIDTSKSIEWVRGQMKANPALDFKLIHLIRDPRGWYASERRRHPIPLSELLDGWSSKNRRIAQFLKSLRAPSIALFYDELAAEPESAFYPACDFTGLPFRLQALQYWERPHHGFAANGASSFLLEQRRQKGADFKFLVTGDDSYYLAHRHSLFLDDRWRTALPAGEAAIISGRNDVRSLLADYGRELSAAGVIQLELAGGTRK